MHRFLGHRAGRVVLLLAFLLAPASVRADMGPRFEEPRIIVRFTRQGRRLSEPFEALLLRPQPAGNPGIDLSEDSGFTCPWVKKIACTARSDLNSGSWKPTTWFGYYQDTGRGVATFPFRPNRGPVPTHVRVALYFPEEQRVVVTNAVPTRPYITELTVDLLPDGTASLGVTPRWPVAVVLDIFKENAPYPVFALLLTVILELLVVAACAWFGKGLIVPRLYGVVVFGNLTTVPLVWLMSVAAKIQLVPGGWPALFILAELTATAFEGWLYYRIARFPFSTGLIWSSLANSVTFLVGCGLVAFTV